MISLALLLTFSLQGASPAASADQARYEGCLDRIAAAPDLAHDDAISWRLRGGGWPARHCEALSLIALGDPAEGARRLEAAAVQAAGGGPVARGVMLGQAGDAWRLAGRFDAALAAFDAGLAHLPGEPGLLIGRAQALAALERYEDAEAAAGAAIEAFAGAPEAYRIRGEVRLALGDLDGAEADAAAARRLAPEDIAVLKLRGDVRVARLAQSGSASR